MIILKCISSFSKRKIEKQKLLQFARNETSCGCILRAVINDKYLLQKEKIIELQHDDLCQKFIDLFPEWEGAYQSKFFPKQAVCIRTFWSEENGYFVYGTIIYIKLHKKWFNYVIDDTKEFYKSLPSKEDFKITLCGCSGDVNTFRHLETVIDDYFILGSAS